MWKTIPYQQRIADSTLNFLLDLGEQLGGWEWVCHNTFAEPLHPEQAEKRFNRWIRDINRELFGRRYGAHGNGVFWARGTERQERDAIHYHALIGGGVRKLKRLSWMDSWHQDAEGFARIWPPADLQKSIRYVTKYQVKGGEVDIYVPPSLMWKIREMGS